MRWAEYCHHGDSQYGATVFVRYTKERAQTYGQKMGFEENALEELGKHKIWLDGRKMA